MAADFLPSRSLCCLQFEIRGVVGQETDSAAFEIMTIPIGQYRHHPQLDQIEAEANQIIEVLHEFGGKCDGYPITRRELDETSVKRLLRDWANRETSRSGVLVWLGHGVAIGADAWLASSETPCPIEHNGIGPQTLADQVDVDWRRRDVDDDLGSWALVVIEACGAGTFVRSLAAMLPKSGVRRAALVGVGGDGAANLGRLKEA